MPTKTWDELAAAAENIANLRIRRGKLPETGSRQAARAYVAQLRERGLTLHAANDCVYGYRAPAADLPPLHDVLREHGEAQEDAADAERTEKGSRVAGVLDIARRLGLA